MAYRSALSYLDEPSLDELASLQAAPPPRPALSQFQQDVAAVPPPELQDVPAEYVPQEYTPGGLDRFAEDYASGLGNLQLSRPRTVGQGILLGLSGALAGRGARVARARESFQQHEAARAKSVDEQRKLATQANLALLGNYKGQITRTLLEQAVGAEKARQEAPEKEAARKRQAEQDARQEKQFALQQQNAERAQRALDRQNDIATTNTTSDLATKFAADPDVQPYRAVTTNLKLANVAAKQASGTGDYALIRAYVRSTEDPKVPSVVREAEERGVALSFGQLQRISNLPAQYFSGSTIKPEGRQKILTQMRESAATLKPAYDQAYAQYRNRVEEFGKASGLKLNPKNVLREYITTEDTNDKLEKDSQLQELTSSGE